MIQRTVAIQLVPRFTVANAQQQQQQQKLRLKRDQAPYMRIEWTAEKEQEDEEKTF